jgi:hypothetical protein
MSAEAFDAPKWLFLGITDGKIMPVRSTWCRARRGPARSRELSARAGRLGVYCASASSAVEGPFFASERPRRSFGQDHGIKGPGRAHDRRPAMWRGGAR